MKKTLLYNGEVFTVNDKDEIAEAVLFEGNTILFAGSNAEALALCGADTEKIDAEGKTILPGFIETHIHITSELTFALGINLSAGAGITSIRALQKKLREAELSLEEDEWLMGHGFNFEDLAEHRWPTRQELDAVCPDRPTVIVHSSAHTGLYNTKALELIHLFDGTVDYSPVHVFKDEEGRPNGVLTEVAHFKAMNVIAEEYCPLTEARLMRNIRRMCRKMNAAGITTACDAGGTGTTTINAMQKLAMNREMTVRMMPMLFSTRSLEDNIKFVNAQIDSGFFTGLGDDYMKIGPLKIMVDGSGASGTCCTREPMSHNGKCMPPSMNQELIDDIVIRAHQAGFQITAHCIGDRGTEMMLDAYERAQANYPRRNCRHRIEHCMIAEPDLLARIRDLEIIPTFNPAFLNQWGSTFNKYYGGKRNAYLIPVRTAIDMGIVGTIASDWACIPDMSPLKGIASAIDRTVYETGETVAANQAITLHEAIRCVTKNAAYACFEENRRGSLEPGKLADILILDGKITEKTPREIYDMSVERTYFDGKPVFEK